MGGGGGGGAGLTGREGIFFNLILRCRGGV